MFQKILVALDGINSDGSLFKHALDLAKVTGSRLLLVHVLNLADQDYPDYVIYPAVGAYDPTLYDEVFKRWQEKLSEYEQHRQEKLRSLASEAEAAGVTTEFMQDIGDPGRMICAVARTWEADLIVVGRRGRSGLQEVLLGSVSNYVMHHAPCSVLTIQGQVPAPLAPDSRAEAVTR
jgi:nucleotide-binding universal stress UspA family protein